MTDRIRIVLAEDQRLLLDALAALLELEHDIVVVARAQNGKQALEAVLEHQPDVFITDIEMPEMTGLDVVRQMQGRCVARTLIVTTFARAGYLRRALEVGAAGYVLKTKPAHELADVVRRVHRGSRVIDAELAAEALADLDSLTEREREVLRLTAEGRSTADIAADLGLAKGTVRNYLSESIDKLHAANRFDAARIAREKGWL